MFLVEHAIPGTVTLPCHSERSEHTHHVILSTANTPTMSF